jgi:hypothetical protein
MDPLQIPDHQTSLKEAIILCMASKFVVIPCVPWSGI